jgi:hypothetical protein
MVSLRPTEMRHDYHFGALADERLDCRREPINSGHIGHDAVLHRHVQIGAQQHPLSADVDVIESSKFWHGGLPSFRDRGRLDRRAHPNRPK